MSHGCGSFPVSPVPGSCLLSPVLGRLIRAGRAVPAGAAQGRPGNHRDATSMWS